MSKRPLPSQRSKPEASSTSLDAGERIARDQAGPSREGTEGQSSRVPRDSARSLTLATTPEGSLSASPVPIPDENAPLHEYKGFSLKNVGYDVHGRVLPHKYSLRAEKQIMVWVAGGADVNAICIRLNIRPGKLKELYGKALAIGLDQVTMDMTESIVTRAKKSDRLAVFFAKAKMGWRDGESRPLDTGLLNIIIHT